MDPGFYISIKIDTSQSHWHAILSTTVLNMVYVHKYFVRIKKNHC